MGSHIGLSAGLAWLMKGYIDDWFQKKIKQAAWDAEGKSYNAGSSFPVMPGTCSSLFAFEAPCVLVF